MTDARFIDRRALPEGGYRTAGNPLEPYLTAVISPLSVPSLVPRRITPADRSASGGVNWSRHWSPARRYVADRPNVHVPTITFT
jgi:hypothetical protein